MWWLRYWIGSKLIHAGLSVMPHGAARDELTRIVVMWSRHVHETVAAKRAA